MNGNNSFRRQFSRLLSHGPLRIVMLVLKSELSAGAARKSPRQGRRERARTFLYTPGSCTLVGLSAMFMSVALTIWLFTVYCVPLPMRPAPASRSLMNSEHLRAAPRARA